MYHVGHGGGGWIQHICNNHPHAQMSIIAECDAKNCLAFKSRGKSQADYDSEIHNFFESRIHYGGDVIGIIKSFHSKNIQWAAKHVGTKRVKVCQMMRNPRVNFPIKWQGKQKDSVRYFKRRHKRGPENEREWFEAVCYRYIDRFYARFLKAAGKYPVIRLEDLNKSMAGNGRFFQQFMEWLTGIQWSNSYVNHIREHNKPSACYTNWVEWDKWPNGKDRVSRVCTTQDEKLGWPYRDNWNEDPDALRLWNLDRESDYVKLGYCLTGWKKDDYLRFIGPYEKRLGYNQSYVGCVEREWECRKQYPWGEP